MIDLKSLAQRVRAFFGKDTVTGLEAFEFDTAGADAVRDTFTPRISERSGFVDGWWGGVVKRPINPGRIGGAINAWSTVVHTTDMVPGTFEPLLKRWAAVPGEGAGAHFLIGKTEEAGVAQLAPITRNANHAGGSLNGKPSHGWYRMTNGRLIHPNSVSVGIEIDNAGRLIRAGSGGRGDAWVHKDSGRVFPRDSVFVDVHGRGYELVTGYQLHALEVLLDALDAALPLPPVGTTIVPNGTYKDNGVPEASLPWVREVGHWTLDPLRKSDPGPQVDAFLELRAARSRR